jgi:hypothetical protein
MENFDLRPIADFMQECQLKLDALLEQQQKEFDTTEYEYTDKINDLTNKNEELEDKLYTAQQRIISLETEVYNLNHK